MTAEIYQVIRYQIPEQIRGRFAGKTLDTLAPDVRTKLVEAVKQDITLKDARGRPLPVKVRVHSLSRGVVTASVKFPHGVMPAASAA